MLPRHQLAFQRAVAEHFPVQNGLRDVVIDVGFVGMRRELLLEVCERLIVFVVIEMLKTGIYR